MNFEKLQKNNIFISLISSLIILFIFFGILKPFFSSINLDIAYFLKSFLPEQKISKNIVFVKIDDKTTKKLHWPFKRSFYNEAIKNIQKDGAKVIGLDVFFSDNSEVKDDEKLADSFKKYGKIIIGGVFSGENANFLTPIFLDKKFSLLYYKKQKKAYKQYLKKNKNSGEKIQSFKEFSKNYKQNHTKFYPNSVKTIGSYNPTINRQNNKVYSLSPKATTKDNISLEHISFAITRNFLDLGNKIKNYSKNYYLFGDKKIPLNSGQFFINFPSKIDKFNEQSFYDIYKGKFKTGTFKDKLVLIGYTARGAQDLYTVAGIGKAKGVYVILYTINNILQNSYIIFFNKTLEFFLIFIIIFLSTYYTISKRSISIKWGILGFFIIFFLSFIFYILYASYILTTSGNIIILNYPILLILSVFFAFFIANIINFIREDKNKKTLNKALGEYVSKDIAKEILEGEGKINLNGEKKEISIFFSDIEGFTSISEKMNPKELVQFLQKYLGTMSEIIMNHKGFIDKYEGDAIMALFGVFGETYKTKTFDILESSLAQKEKLEELNKEFIKTIGQEIKVRMGIHKGEAIIGNIGAKGKKMEFTALGDSVNLASRLEGVNKFYNTYICCSEDIFKEQNSNFIFRYLDNIKVKGKEKGVKIFELVGRKGEVEQKILDKIILFEKGLGYYFEKNWQKAIEFFKQAEELGDRTSTIFISRSQFFIKNPPKQNWDGIWEFKEK